MLISCHSRASRERKNIDVSSNLCNQIIYKDHILKNQEGFKCEECESTSDCTYHLKEHIAVVHRGEAPNDTEMCENWNVGKHSRAKRIETTQHFTSRR